MWLLEQINRSCQARKRAVKSMYLIVDSGSTKTDWFAVDQSGEVLFSTQTLGLKSSFVLSHIK